MQWPSLAFCKFSTKGQIRYAKKAKRHDIFTIIELFPPPVRFSLLKYLMWEKYFNYPLTTMQDYRFASCENIVSQSQTSSLSPWFILIIIIVIITITTINFGVPCEQRFLSCMAVRVYDLVCVAYILSCSCFVLYAQWNN